MNTRLVRRIFSDHSLVILTLATALSLFLTIFSYRERELMAKSISRLETENRNLSTLKVGDLVPSIQLMNNKRESVRLTYQEDKKHLLVVFSINCAACKIQDESIWNDLAAKLEPQGITTQGILLGDTNLAQDYLSQRKFNFSVLSPDVDTFSRSYRISRLPQIILVDEEGKVVLLHHGTMQKEALESFIGKIATFSRS